MSWTIPPEFLGETVFILGCGPSLETAPVERLRDRRIIAINDSYLRVPRADVLYFCDGLKWWRENEREIQEHFRGRYMVTAYVEGRPPDIPGVKVLRLTGITGLENDPGALRHGSNSGYQAINLAYHFGARRIVLLGMDMRTNGKNHWRPRNKEMPEPVFQRKLQHQMLPNFRTLVDPLRKAGIEVLNATPDSALRFWPMVDLEEILE